MSPSDSSSDRRSRDKLYQRWCEHHQRPSTYVVAIHLGKPLGDLDHRGFDHRGGYKNTIGALNGVRTIISSGCPGTTEDVEEKSIPFYALRTECVFSRITCTIVDWRGIMVTPLRNSTRTQCV